MKILASATIEHGAKTNRVTRIEARKRLCCDTVYRTPHTGECRFSDTSIKRPGRPAGKFARADREDGTDVVKVCISMTAAELALLDGACDAEKAYRSDLLRRAFKAYLGRHQERLWRGVLK